MGPDQLVLTGRRPPDTSQSASELEGMPGNTLELSDEIANSLRGLLYPRPLHYINYLCTTGRTRAIIRLRPIPIFST